KGSWKVTRQPPSSRNDKVNNTTRQAFIGFSLKRSGPARAARSSGRCQHQMQVPGKDSEHLPIGLRIRVLEQALIFHLLDYRRQHLGILLGMARPDDLEHLPRTL